MEGRKGTKGSIIGGSIILGFIIWDKCWWLSGTLFVIAGILMISDYI